MNDLTRDIDYRQSVDVQSPTLDGADSAPAIESLPSIGATLVEENLDTGESFFIVKPSMMPDVVTPLVGGRGCRPLVAPEYREALEAALDQVGVKLRVRCVAADKKTDIWIEASTVKFYTGEKGEPLRLVSVKNLTAEQGMRNLEAKAVDAALNHFQANLLIENLSTKEGTYIVRHARQSHQQTPLCAERRLEKMLEHEREGFVTGVSKVGGAAEFQWLLPSGEREWFRMINLGESANPMGETQRLLMGYCIADEKHRQAELEAQIEERDRLNRQLQSVAEAARVGYMRTDYLSGGLELDAMAREILDLPVSEFPHARFEDYISRVHSEEREASLNTRARCMKEGVGYMSVRRFVWGDGSVHHVRINFKPVFKAGLYIGSEAILVDISDVQRANNRVKERSADLERACAIGNIGILKHRWDSDRIELNSIAREQLNLPMQLCPIVRFKDYLAALDAVDPDQVRSFIEGKIAQGVKNYKVERQVKTVDGSLRYLEITIERRQGSSGQLHLEGVILDVTDRVLRERKMREQQQQREEMFAVIGHELRTPAATLKMLAEQLETAGETPDSTATHQMIKSTAEHLLTVLDDLRQVAQPERQRSRERKAVNLPEFLEGVVNSLRPLAEARGFSLGWDLQRADFQSAELEISSLRQVVTNLTKNALIHSGGDRVVVKSELETSDAGISKLKLSVSDNGVGIPEDQIEQLFTPFVRGKSDAEGTGLGLPICRDLIRGLGGELEHHTTAEGGSAFTIDLEVRPIASAAPTEPSADPSSIFNGLRVLIAEDNLTIRMLSEKMLQARGATVTCAENGHRALQLFADGAFDLVLSDIFMPEMNGYDLVSELRRQGFNGPIVGLTAATIGHETENMKQAGADVIFAKPIDLKMLGAWLNRIFNS